MFTSGHLKSHWQNPHKMNPSPGNKNPTGRHRNPKIERKNPIVNSICYAQVLPAFTKSHNTRTLSFQLCVKTCASSRLKCEKDLRPGRLRWHLKSRYVLKKKTLILSFSLGVSQLEIYFYDVHKTSATSSGNRGVHRVNRHKSACRQSVANNPLLDWASSPQPRSHQHPLI